MAFSLPFLRQGLPLPLNPGAETADKMKALANLVKRMSRSREAAEDLFDSRLKSLTKPQHSKRPTRTPKPVLFRRAVIQ
jgi:hypothetical protein